MLRDTHCYMFKFKPKLFLLNGDMSVRESEAEGEGPAGEQFVDLTF